MTIDNQNGRIRDIEISHMKDDIRENKKNNATIAQEIIALKLEQARLSERMMLYQIVQGVFTILATGLAAYLAFAR